MAGAVVFGSDQGLVGRFDDVIADYALNALTALPGKPQVWAVGERAHARLEDAGLKPVGLFAVPNSIKAITPLVGRILRRARRATAAARSRNFTFSITAQRPGLVMNPRANDCCLWTKTGGANSPDFRGLPETCPKSWGRRHDLARAYPEYLFVSLFRACAESLASENASRLAAMQRADKNIDELLEEFKGAFHRLRQSGIDEELFDVISGFEALSYNEAMIRV